MTEGKIIADQAANRLTYQVQESDEGEFLRNILLRRLRISRSLLVRLKQHQRIFVNGLVTRTNYRVCFGDEVAVFLTLPEENLLLPQPMALDIVYEDDDFLVVNKPAGLSTHPSKFAGTGSLANGVTYYWQQQGLKMRFRPINRLDRDTSGLLLIGKSHYAHQAIFAEQKKVLRRGYLALVEGCVALDAGVIDLPIAVAEPGGRRRVVRADGQAARTHYQVVKRYSQQTLLRLQLETGRTHQIRVHLSHLGHPLCGDELYGGASPLIARQALHAYELGFVHPRSGRTVTLHAPLPPDMAAACTGLAR